MSKEVDPGVSVVRRFGGAVGRLVSVALAAVGADFLTNRVVEFVTDNPAAAEQAGSTALGVVLGMYLKSELFGSDDQPKIPTPPQQ